MRPEQSKGSCCKVCSRLVRAGHGNLYGLVKLTVQSIAICFFDYRLFISKPKQELHGKKFILGKYTICLPNYLEGWCKRASLGAKHKLLSARSNVQLEHKALTTRDRALQSAQKYRPRNSCSPMFYFHAIV